MTKLNLSNAKGFSWNLRKLFKHGTFKWVLGRYACLGSEVEKRLQLGLPVQNAQKGRIDFQLSLESNTDLRPNIGIIKPFLVRDEIIDLAIQQAALPFQSCFHPRFFLMDSFAELTDQLFVHNEKKWQFCYNWSDLRHDEEFDTTFTCRGLMPIDQYQQYYERFFETLFAQHPGLPVVYLHFSTALDPRDKFKPRAQALQETLETLSSKYPTLHSVSLEDDQVHPPANDYADEAYRTFPYHYSSGTYDLYAEQCRSLFQKMNVL